MLGALHKVRTPKAEARILNWTRKKPTDGSTHWKKNGIQPHRMERYMASNDPHFEKKAADVIGLYLRPPQHAVVFSVDEKTAIQALDRKDPILPLSPGRAERHGFEYVRHTSQEFVAFLSDLVAKQPVGQEIHIICDNLSAHKTSRVADFLEEHPTVELHFTPTYSSWLNQVELWFAKIERDLIHRGVFTSVNDLARRIMTFIRKHNEDPTPIKWNYDNPKRRIRVAKQSSVTGN